MTAITIRPELPGDHQAIHDLTRDAFAGKSFSDGTEAAIPGTLRAAGALTLSIVAVDRGVVVGHAAFSPVTIITNDAEPAPGQWFGLGPVAVQPERQRSGIGQSLIRSGLDRLRASGAGGCVVLGDAKYYGRFGYVHDPDLTYAGAPAHHFQRLTFTGPPPSGAVVFHPAFESEPSE